MKRKQTIILISIFAGVILIGLIIGLILLRGPQTFINRAAPMCPANGSTCSWESKGTATSFNVEIIDQTTGQTLLSTTTTGKAIQFTPVVNHTYKCVVTPVNACGAGPATTGINTCVAASTPTPTQAPTSTPNPTPTVVMRQQPSTCMSNEACTTSGGTTNGVNIVTGKQIGRAHV